MGAILICTTAVAGSWAETIPVSECPESIESDWIMLTLVEVFDVAGQSYGLDISEPPGGAPCLLSANPLDDVVQEYDAVTGTPVVTMPLDSANTECRGTAFNNDSKAQTYITADGSKSELYLTGDHGATWTVIPSPWGTSGYGMDYYEDYYYIATDDGIYRFQPGGDYQLLSTPEIGTDLITGVTVFPREGEVILAAATCIPPFIWFYKWNGSDLSYFGVAACPGGPSMCFGISHSENTGYLYCSCYDCGMEIAVIEMTNVFLSRETWAGIKLSLKGR